MSGRDPRRNYNRYRPVLRPNSHNPGPINPHHNDEFSRDRGDVTVYHRPVLRPNSHNPGPINPHHNDEFSRDRGDVTVYHRPVLRPNSHNPGPINPHHNDEFSRDRGDVTVYHRPVLRPNSHNPGPINPHHNDEFSRDRGDVTVYHVKRSVSQYAVSNELIKSTGYYTGAFDRERLSRPTDRYVPSYQSRMPIRSYIPTTITSPLAIMEASDVASPTTNPSTAALSSERSSNSLQTSNSDEHTDNTQTTKRIPMARRSKCNLDRYVPYILGKPEYIKNALLRLIQVTRHIPDLQVTDEFINKYLQSVFAKRISSHITNEEIMKIIQKEASEGKNAST